ncbi:replicative DNA helicase [Rosistilla oblonga]|uniref:DNA 5'-3' helicase n=1 Tax=Rosistilla oblonga TaxID=2527990 RepID=A0A518ITI7_9BACT|nr:DnaB-like helicase C-terminal domain-containing protein [Rosistilla oblonga]QDV56390.1 Replicative DNA helicase [Rosistilla oblonga]
MTDEANPPADEAAVLAGMILDPKQIDAVVGHLSAADFQHNHLRELFGFLIDANAAGRPTDSRSVLMQLRESGALKRIGASFIGRLTNAIGSAANVPYHVAKVRHAAILRRIRQVVPTIEAIADDDTQTPTQILDRIDAELIQIRQYDQPPAAVSHLGDDALRLCDEIDAAAGTGETRGLRTGLECFDQINGGFQDGTLNIIAARPSNGKSVLGLQWAQSIGTGFDYSVSDEGNYFVAQQPPKSTLFISLEMTRAELSARALASTTRIDGRRINSYRTTADQRRRLRAAAESMKATQTRLWQPHRATVSSIRATARLHQRQHGLGCLVVDYMQLVDSERGAKHDKETYRIGEICRGFKSLAMELGIPVVVLAQLNRESEGSLPTLAQLADSGKIEQHADTITAIHRQRGETNDANLVLLKWRNGKTPTIDITFDRQHSRFVGIEPKPVQPFTNLPNDTLDYDTLVRRD